MCRLRPRRPVLAAIRLPLRVPGRSSPAPLRPTRVDGVGEAGEYDDDAATASFLDRRLHLRLAGRPLGVTLLAGLEGVHRMGHETTRPRCLAPQHPRALG